MAPPDRKTNAARKVSATRKWLLVATMLLIVIGGVSAVLALYPSWNQNRLIRRSRASIVWKDYDGAALMAKRALQINDRSVPAVTLLAEIAEARNPSESLFWRRRLVDLQPSNLEARLVLAEKALAMRKPALAKDALEGVDEKGKQSARYHYSAGQLALSLGIKATAETEFSLAARMEPTNSDYQIGFAALQIESDDKQARERAREVLDAYFAQPATLARVAPSLIGDALRRGDHDRALSVADGVRLREGASWEDSLYYLQLQHYLKRPSYGAFLSEMQEKASDSAERVYGLISWMTANDSTILAIEWSKRLPAQILDTMPVPMAIARAYSNLRDWAGLKPLVEVPDAPKDSQAGVPATGTDAPADSSWRAYEFMRLALRARALREQGRSSEWLPAWSAAVKAASDRPAALVVLAKATLEWNWEQESTELLWLVGRGPSEPMWALNLLYSKYAAAQATRSMLQVATRMYEVEPANRWVRNNLASLSLLLQTNMDQATKLAEELHREEPANPAYSSTAAFARYMSGNTNESVSLMRALGDEQLRQPQYAAYFGFMLAAAGERQQAKEYLLTGKGAPLLAEERDLVERALKDINR